MANADLNDFAFDMVEESKSAIAGTNLHNYEWKREQVGNSIHDSPMTDYE